MTAKKRGEEGGVRRERKPTATTTRVGCDGCGVRWGPVTWGTRPAWWCSWEAGGAPGRLDGGRASFCRTVGSRDKGSPPPPPALVRTQARFWFRGQKCGVAGFGQARGTARPTEHTLQA